MAEEQRDESFPNDNGGQRNGAHDDITAAKAVGGESMPYPAPLPSVVRLHGPSLNDAVGGDRGEEEQQIAYVGSVENEVPNEDVVNKSGQHLITPKIGMTFESEEEAYEMYNSYAGKVGFSIRKSKTKHRRDGSLCTKFIVCSNQGHRKNEQSQKDVTRTDCNARVQFSVSKEGIWTVQKVIEHHNHYIASPNKAHKLRSQRQVIQADIKLIGQTRDEHARPSSAMDVPFVRDVNSIMPQFNLVDDPSTMAVSYIPGGYTSLLLGVDQNAVRKTHFDGV